MRFFLPLLLLTTALAADTVERWGTYAIALHGPVTGNPFFDIRVEGHFRYENRVIDAAGFHDGDSAYRIRFMPAETGPWTYTTSSNAPALDGKTGASWQMTIKPISGTFQGKFTLKLPAVPYQAVRFREVL